MARCNEVVQVLAGSRRRIPIARTETIRLTPSMAARLDLVELRTGWTVEQFILDLLDDALPAPSREQSTSRE